MPAASGTPASMRHASISPEHRGTPPSWPAPLVGREEELAALRAWLHPGGPRLVTLTGPAGVGKTRLAVAESFRDGVRFVSLAFVPDTATALAAVTQAVGGVEGEEQPLEERLARTLAGSELLHLSDGAERMATVIPVVQLLARGPAASAAPLFGWARGSSGPPPAPRGRRPVPPPDFLSRIGQRAERQAWRRRLAGDAQEGSA